MQIGNFVYANPEDKVKLTFEGRRNFVVVLSSAYNALGLIGSERNGIAILDDDRKLVLARSLFIGNQAAQRSVRDDLLAKKGDWYAFCEAVAALKAEHPQAFDQALPDDLVAGSRRQGEPDRFDPVLARIGGNEADLPEGPDIRTPVMIEANGKDSNPYAFAARTREEMIVAICSHRFRGSDYGRGGNRFAWNVKVHGDFHGDGCPRDGGAEVNEAFGDVWQKTLADDYFSDACATALRPYFDGEATTYPGTDQGEWVFASEGRSNGWLVLQSWRGRPISFDRMEDLVEDFRGMSDEELSAFYAGIVSFDHDLSRPGQSLDFVYNSDRSAAEERWASQPDEFFDDMQRCDVPLEMVVKAAVQGLAMTPGAVAERLSASHEIDEIDAAFEAADVGREIVSSPNPQSPSL